MSRDTPYKDKTLQMHEKLQWSKPAVSIYRQQLYHIKFTISGNSTLLLIRKIFLNHLNFYLYSCFDLDPKHPPKFSCGEGN